MNFFDKMVFFFSPRLALKRHAARNHLALLGGSQRKYEGASSSGRLKLWNPTDSSANKEIKGDAVTLRKRARELRRNNAYAHRAIQVITTNVVGSGIKPVFETKNKSLTKFIDEAWDQWAEKSTDSDFSEMQSLQGLQSQIMDAVVESGEAFVLRQRLSNAKGIPLQLQVLEADFLDMSHNEDFSGGGKIRQGIEFDRRGKRVAYHFYKNHPGDVKTTTEKVKVPVDRVLHIYEKKRPGQIRGVTFLHPVIVRLRDLDVFQDATLQKQQISACYAAFLHNASGDTLDNTYSSETEWEVLEKLDSGTIEHLPPGVDIRFSDPPKSDDYPAFVKTELMSIASGLGITYEALTQDYGNVNFSSARMGFLEFQRNIKRWQNEIMIMQFLNGVFDWFLDAIQFAEGARNLNINPDKIKVRWTTPAREMIDPSKEVPAARDAVKAGFKSISEVVRSLGYNPDEVFEERSKELEKLKKLGITTDSDPAVSQTQKTNQGNVADENTETDNEN